MIDELIEKERKEVLLRIQQKKQLEDKIDSLEKEIQELEKKITTYPALIPMQTFNFFQRYIWKRQYNEYLAKIKKRQEDYTAAVEESKLRDKEISEKKEELRQAKSEALTLSNQNDDENELKVLDDRERAIRLIISRHPELRNNISFMKEIVSENLVFLQYDKTENAELYWMAINQAIDNYKANHGTMPEEDYRRLMNSIEKSLELIKKDEKVEGKYHIPVKYLFEAIRKKLTGYKEGNDVFVGLAGLMDYYCERNNRFPKEYGEKLQELWEDKTVRIGVHGLKIDCNNTDDIKSFFTKGIRTSNQQIGMTKLNRTTLVQDYSEKFSFLELLDYHYQGARIYISCYSRGMFWRASQKANMGRN